MSTQGWVCWYDIMVYRQLDTISSPIPLAAQPHSRILFWLTRKRCEVPWCFT